MNLAGLMDNGLSGIMAEVGERTWSSKGCSNGTRGTIFAGVGLGWGVTIRCCKRDFRGCFVVVRRSANWGWAGTGGLLEAVPVDVAPNGPLVWTCEIVFRASTISSTALIVNLTSESFESTGDGVRSSSSLSNVSMCNFVSEGDDEADDAEKGFPGDVGFVLNKQWERDRRGGEIKDRNQSSIRTHSPLSCPSMLVQLNQERRTCSRMIGIATHYRFHRLLWALQEVLWFERSIDGYFHYYWTFHFDYCIVLHWSFEFEALFDWHRDPYHPLVWSKRAPVSLALAALVHWNSHANASSLLLYWSRFHSVAEKRATALVSHTW